MRTVEKEGFRQLTPPFPPAHSGSHILPLRDLPNGTSAVVSEMPSQDGCAERLEALGLRVGKVIEKVSGMPFHGPVTLLLDGRQIAIGWKISSCILVSPLKGRFSTHDRTVR